MAFFTASFAASAIDGAALASGLDCWSAGFWHPATSAPTEKTDSEIAARRRFIRSLHRLEILVLYSLKIRSSIMKSISHAQFQNDGFVPIWYRSQMQREANCTVSDL